MFPLLCLPCEIIQEIVVCAANAPYTAPPTAVAALAQTCRAIYCIIYGSPSKPHYNVLARIFCIRFDTDAPRRRFGPLTTCGLADTLKARCCTLQRVEARVVHGEHIVEDLWAVFLMLLEDDGKNWVQLRLVDVERWVKQLILLRGHEVMDQHGWPVETELLQLSVAIFAMIDTRECALTELLNERNDILYRLHPFMFAAHRYPIAHLPTTHHAICSTSRLPPAHVHKFHNMASAPVFPPSSLSHVGHHLTLGRPLAATNAIILTCLRNELQGINISSNVPATRAEADCVGWDMATREDWESVNQMRRDGLGVVVRDTSTSRDRSKRWDADFFRLALAHHALAADPQVDRVLHASWVGTVYEPGSLTGHFLGRALIPDYTWYTRMLAMHPRSLPLVEATLEDHQLGQYIQSIQFTLREHINADLTSHVGNGRPEDGDGVQNGWFPDQLDASLGWRGGIREDGTELVVRDPREPDERYATKRYTTWYPGMDVPFVPADIDTLLREAQEDPMEEDDSVPPRVDVIITGETDEVHGAAWGAAKVYGRVRRNDGLFVLVRVPLNRDSGRWIFRGYLRAGTTLVGRWRETGTTMDVPGYEGGFAMAKVA